MLNPFKTVKARKVSLWLALVLFTAVLLYSVWGITNDLMIWRYQGRMYRRNLIFATHSESLNISQIRSWMTFGYLNTVFALPENYLKLGLKISDRRYPNLSVSDVARQNRTSSTQEIAKVQQLIFIYFNKKSSGNNQ